MYTLKLTLSRPPYVSSISHTSSKYLFNTFCFILISIKIERNKISKNATVRMQENKITVNSLKRYKRIVLGARYFSWILHSISFYLFIFYITPIKWYDKNTSIQSKPNDNSNFFGFEYWIDTQEKKKHKQINCGWFVLLCFVVMESGSVPHLPNTILTCWLAIAIQLCYGTVFLLLHCWFIFPSPFPPERKRYKQTHTVSPCTDNPTVNDSSSSNLHYRYCELSDLHACDWVCMCMYVCVSVFLYSSSIHNGDRYTSFYNSIELAYYKIINNNKNKSSKLQKNRISNHNQIQNKTRLEI